MGWFGKTAPEEPCLLFSARMPGHVIKVFADRVEYKHGISGTIDSIPIDQIASVRPAVLAGALTIETTGGFRREMVTQEKKEIAEAIARAQAAQRSASSRAARGSVADEIAKLAKLRADGHLSDDEFERQKKKLID